MQKLVDNDIDVEDLFCLTEKDLLNMRFSIGAKNRVIQFQQTFKRSDPRVIKNTLLCKNLMELILEQNLGYSLNEFFLVAKSTKSELLKALNSLVTLSHEGESLDTKSIDTIELTNGNENNNQRYGESGNGSKSSNTMQSKWLYQNNDIDNYSNDRFSKEITPIKQRNSSLNSQGEKSSKSSAHIHSSRMSKYNNENVNNQNYVHRRCYSKDKKIPLMFNNFVQPEMMHLEERCKETKYEIQNSNHSKKNSHNGNHVLLSNNMNLIQQEEPSNTTCNSKYIIRRQSRKAPFEKYAKKVEQNLQTCLDNMKRSKKHKLSRFNY